MSKTNESRIITCVYCGMAYELGTPTHGSKVLTEHIKVCEKHPMRKAELTIKKLRSALVGLVGENSLQGLCEIKLGIAYLGRPEDETNKLINAVNALVETMEYSQEDTQ